MTGDVPVVPDVVAGVPELRRLRDEPELGGRLWLVRSPWRGWTLGETFSAMWRWLERPDAEYDADYVLAGAADFLRWDESAARKWHRADDAPEPWSSAGGSLCLTRRRQGGCLSSIR